MENATPGQEGVSFLPPPGNRIFSFLPPPGNRMSAFCHPQATGFSAFCHPQATGCQLFANPGNFFAILYYCSNFAAKERSPKILDESSLGLCGILENSIFPCTHYAFDCDNTKYEISSQMLYHVAPPGQFCHT